MRAGTLYDVIHDKLQKKSLTLRNREMMQRHMAELKPLRVCLHSCSIKREKYINSSSFNDYFAKHKYNLCCFYYYFS